MAITLRQIITPDPKLLPALTRIIRATVDGGASIGFLAPLSEAEALAYWQQAFAELGAGRLLWVAELDGQPVGSVQLAPSLKANGRHRAEIQKLMVHPDYRRRGISALLMAEAEKAAQSMGRWLLVLDTESASAAELVYQKLGWIECGGVPEFALGTNGIPRANVFYYKKLDG